MKLGVCYYPEHWPQERWPIDARLMREAGLSQVRIGEFAWTKMEPADGQFNWDWLDRAIETLAAEGLKVVLCTPTPTPPAWLVTAYPEVLPTDAQGRVRRFGSRRHVCANSPIYRRYSQRIATEMARRYGQHPAVMAWQIDNEFGCHQSTRCYCEHCARAFRVWLQKRYHNLEALNQAWGTEFWNQHYSAWEQIQPPNLTVTEANCSHMLDYYRFASDSFASFQQMQIDVLRQYAPGHPLTHNFMGTFAEINTYDFARPLDFVGWDSYPTGYREQISPELYRPDEQRPDDRLAFDVGDPYVTGFCHTLTYGFKQQPFWVMEQQPGQVNWATYNTLVRPGAVRLWTWHALACGAETVMYFRWRACLYAQEQYHAGLRRHDGSADMGYQEILEMRSERNLMEEVARQPLNAPVALLMDYESLWALELQPHRKEFSYLRHLFVYYRALQQAGIGVDIVPADADLSKYRLVIAGSAIIATPELAQKLTHYVEQGGTLLLGARTGFKTASNLVVDQPLPGVLRDLTGVTVTGWGGLPDGIEFLVDASMPGLDGVATFWMEALQPTSDATRVLARYTSGPYSGSAALTEKHAGAGRTLYLGMYPTIRQAKELVYWLAQQLDIRYIPDLPTGLILTQRGPYTLALNFSDDPLSITIDGQEITAAARQVNVIRRV